MLIYSSVLSSKHAFSFVLVSLVMISIARSDIGLADGSKIKDINGDKSQW
jgi:hypothetical protein